jgi:arsenate reductase
MSHGPITLYHNPRCAKSRATLKLLQDEGMNPTIVEYLKTPLELAELDMLCTALGGDATQMVRFNEPEAKAMKLKPEDTRLRADWLQILADNPKLLQRPIVLRGEKAVIGRPPEKVRELL